MPPLWGLLLLLLAPLYAQSDTSLTRVDFTELKPAGDTALFPLLLHAANSADSASSTARLDTSIQVHTVKPLAPRDTSYTPDSSAKEVCLGCDRKQLLDDKWKNSVFRYWLGLGATGGGIALQVMGLYGREKEPLLIGSTLFLLGTPLMGSGNNGMREVQIARDPAVPGSAGGGVYGFSWLAVLGGGLLIFDGTGTDGEEDSKIEQGLGAICIGLGVVTHYVSALIFAWDGFHAQVQGPHFRVSPVVRMASQGALAPGLEMALNW